MTCARALPSIATVLAFAASATAQGTRPDLAGRWLLQETTVSGGGRGDASGNASGGGGGRGGGTGLGTPADELTIHQSDSVLVVNESHAFAITTIRYDLDGRRIRNSMPVGRGRTANADYSSRWKADTLETSITRRISGGGGSTTIRYVEVLYLQSDSVLVMETVMAGRFAGRKVLYRKAS